MQLTSLLRAFGQFAVICSFGALAHAIGGVTDGGGNVQRSSRADLESIVAGWETLSMSTTDSHLFGETFRITRGPLTGDLRAMTKAIVGENYFTVSPTFGAYLRHLQFNIVDGACVDNDEEKDASTPYAKNATICLSSSRLARFPKGTLQQILVPLVFHEVAHQFGFNEDQANRFQALAELHLKFRPLYLSAWRARGVCAYVTKTPLTAAQKRIAFGSEQSIPSLPENQRTLVLLQCVNRATTAGTTLEKMHDGDLWQKLPDGDLTAAEKVVLQANGGGLDLSFVSMVEALEKPSSQSECPACSQHGVDQAYILMLGARMAVTYIDDEVARLQSQIP